tara:strand:+ start:1119 stop:1502 length:384 start_codon:yes stop_codon:yes gene_type:complete
MKDNIHANLTKKNGKLEFNIKAQEAKYNKLVESLPEGTKVEMFVSASSEKGTNAQLARVHVMIKELASTLGYTFEEMKLLIKRKAGLCIVRNKSEYCKSFADCDKDELNLTIQALIDIGDETGSNLR